MMRGWMIAGVALMLGCHHDDDTLVADFHTVERQCLSTFTDALHRQGENQIDELAFADIVEKQVLPPWHAFGARLAHAPDSELFVAMRRYVADRETAWQAFTVTLRHDDPQALATYHQKNAEADDDARALARLLPR